MGGGGGGYGKRNYSMRRQPEYRYPKRTYKRHYGYKGKRFTRKYYEGGIWLPNYK